MNRACSLLAAVCIVGCARSPAPRHSHDSAPALPRVENQSTPSAAAPRDPTPPPPTAAPVPAGLAPAATRQLMRKVHSEGAQLDVRVEGLGELLSTGSDGKVVVDLLSGARLEVEHDSQIFVPEFVPGGLVVIAGSVFLSLPPDGGRPDRPAQRIATAHASLLVLQAGELVVAQRTWSSDTNGAAAELLAQTFVARLRGDAAVQRLDATSGKLLSSSLVESNAAGLDDPRIVGLPALATARAAAQSFLAKRQRPRSVRDQDLHLERALDELAAERVASAKLLQRVLPSRNAPSANLPAPPSAATPPAAIVPAGAVADSAGPISAAPHGTSEVRAFQRELAEHAKHKSELREALLLAAEQSLLARLARCHEPTQLATCPFLNDWQTRFSVRLAASL
jgi:hypothetical protein